jgi:5-bromo-4-chloroindolyl phosphate hydrolysis protein
MKNYNEISSENQVEKPNSWISRFRNPAMLFLVALWVAAACLLVVVAIVGLVFNVDLSGTLAYATWGLMQLVLLTLVIYIAWKVKLWIEEQTGNRTSSKTELSALHEDIAMIRRIVEETRERVERVEKILEDVSE